MSDIIKRLRALNGLTQEDVAKKLEMASRTYCKKEANPDLFTVGELKKLAILFEVKEDIFFKDKLTVTVN